MTRFWWAAGAVAAGLAVAFGAFGAHGLKAMVDEKTLEIFYTGARYHMYHAFALFLVAIASDKQGSKALNASGICFILGLFLFSGSLYTMTLTGMRWLGAITPIGGVLFMTGWGLLGYAGFRTQGPSQ